MAKTNTAELGFEKQIWKAADLLRGNMDASEYKSVVLGLIFLKYISDSFEAKHQALINEGEGFEEDKDEYSYEHIFFVPKEARWSVIAEAAHTPVSMLGKMFNTTNFPLASAREKVLKSPFTSEKSGACTPFCINSPASATGVP